VLCLPTVRVPVALSPRSSPRDESACSRVSELTQLTAWSAAVSRRLTFQPPSSFTVVSANLPRSAPQTSWLPE